MIVFDAKSIPNFTIDLSFSLIVEKVRGNSKSQRAWRKFGSLPRVASVVEAVGLDGGCSNWPMTLLSRNEHTWCFMGLNQGFSDLNRNERNWDVETHCSGWSWICCLRVVKLGAPWSASAETTSQSECRLIWKPSFCDRVSMPKKESSCV